MTSGQFLELVVGDERIPGVGRHRTSLDRGSDQRDRATWFEQIEHCVGDTVAIGPVQRLAERDQPEHAQVEPADVLGHVLDPADVADMCGPCARRAFGQHVGIGIQADRVPEVRCELDGEHAGTASDIEEAPRQSAGNLFAEHPDQVA
jgi:hypothetical protein